MLPPGNVKAANAQDDVDWTSNFWQIAARKEQNTLGIQSSITIFERDSLTRFAHMFFGIIR
jgi:hypothetical protein